MFKNLSTDALGVSGTPNETIELALSHGFKGIDLNLVDFARQVASRGLAASRRLLDSARLKFGSFDLPVDCDADEEGFAADLKRLPGLIQWAVELGCLRAVTTVAPASESRPYHQNFECYRQRFGQLCEVLAPQGIRLGVGLRAAAELRQGKSFEFIHQLAPLKMLLGMVGSGELGLLLDHWNWHVAGSGIAEVQALPVGQIVAVRLADLPQGVAIDSAKQSQRLLPGTGGVIDSAGLLTALAELGYDGPVTPYPHSSCFSGQSRDEIGRRTGEALSQVWKAAGLSPAGKLSTTRK